MIEILNKLDGSKLVIFWSFTLALIAIIFIGVHIVLADGATAPAEIGFLEQVVQSVLVAGGGISTVHVVTGAVVAHKANKNQPPAAPPSGAAQP
ncbi:MAG TPA: hypothetical protein VH593_12185 [Ktedonobacteraceae bacterium]|jgi:hypothetical protein